jgi:hypothetical protein
MGHLPGLNADCLSGSSLLLGLFSPTLNLLLFVSSAQGWPLNADP